jgi:hypothetical protein
MFDTAVSPFTQRERMLDVPTPAGTLHTTDEAETQVVLMEDTPATVEVIWAGRDEPKPVPMTVTRPPTVGMHSGEREVMDICALHVAAEKMRKMRAIDQCMFMLLLL